jgi:NAD(P)-dependent dehydrogenase (short-subunit alcohol dehydrogenase family)
MTRVLGYASAKAAIDNLTKWMAVELNSKYGPDFQVNAIAPGFFLTEQNRTLLTETDGSLTQRGNQIIDHTPMRRFGKPEDLLGTLQWLCSDASKFVTGTIIAVDGGFSAYSGV